MIARIWRGYTTVENAEAYEQLLRAEIFTHIKERKIQGFQESSLLKRHLAEEVEFITIMKFDSIDSIKEFAGEAYEVAVVPDAAKKLLKRFDSQSQHYQIIESTA